jgi:DNA invertase Pin-like site-specific DNA recombinase
VTHDGRLVVGYARVSTTQDAQDISIEMQVAEFERLGVDQVISERRSASKGHRPGWAELRLMVARGQVRRVLIADLSRLARDGSDMQFLEECAAAGTEVRDLFGQLWENQTISGLLSSGVTSLMNRVQARMIGLKCADGLRRRREAGFLARGRLPFGYRVVNCQPAMDPDTWEQARWLFELTLEKQMAFRLVIRALPDDFPWIPTVTGLLNWVRNPMLRGGVGYGRRQVGEWESVEWGRAPRLITTEEYQNAMRFYLARRETKTRERKGAEAHLLTSLLRCASCGKNMGWKTPRRDTHATRYQCRTVSCRHCGKTVREDLVRAELARVLVKQAKKMAEAVMDDTPVEIPPEEARLGEQLRQLEDLEAQGVPNLRKGILGLRDQIALMRMDRIVDPWLTPDYQDIFSSERCFLLSSDADLRPVLLRFVKRVDYQPSSGVIRVVLR